MPKPFEFKLQRVLDYRRLLEDEAVATLARAKARHDSQQARKDDIESKLTTHTRTGLKKNAQSDDIWLWRQYKTALEQDLSDARAELARLALKLQNCRQDAVERSRERKLLEKLKDNQAARYEHEQSLKEQKEFDELSILRHKVEDI